MPAERLVHFRVIAVVGSEKVGTGEQENDLCLFDAVVDHTMPVSSWWDGPVGPFANDVLTVEEDELASNRFHEVCVFMRIREEDPNWLGHMEWIES
jgi:hypothetical protein